MDVEGVVQKIHQVVVLEIMLDTTQMVEVVVLEMCGVDMLAVDLEDKIDWRYYELFKLFRWLSFTMHWMYKYMYWILPIWMSRCLPSYMF